MRKHLLLASALLFLPALLSAENFAGTWQASFKGAIFCTLTIATGSGLSGTLSPGRISVNDDGDLTDAEAASPDGSAPILNAKIEGATLAFEWKESADDDPLKLEVKITGENEAELRFVGAERIKPIHLHRTESHSK